ncbi:hypothetical protein ACFXC8_22340 [Streptomyces sp. NPDC059441]|uniref:hypothetical protein n=1 Tax=Streptomyces sp. NPDC059441 TaxID=3346829 RepID=UPI0036797F45
MTASTILRGHPRVHACQLETCAERIETLTGTLAEAGDAVRATAIELARRTSGTDVQGRKAAARQAKQTARDAPQRLGVAADRHDRAVTAWQKAQQAVAALQPPCRDEEGTMLRTCGSVPGGHAEGVPSRMIL